MANQRPRHQSLGVQSYADRRSQRDRNRSAGRIYGWRWQKLRAAYLVQYPLCSCGCGYPATVVDHKKPHNGDPALMYDWDNLQSMTKQCHDRKTATYDGGFGNPISNGGSR
jgi:5-methylcytosine-specific restriction protein A